MAGLFGAVTHDLGQSLPNTFHRTAGNLYDGVAGQNGVLTGGGLKNTFKTATSIFGALNFVPTIAGLGVAGLANGIYNKASGKGGFFEGLAAPTKRAANWAKEGVTGTMGNTGKLVSGTGKAIAGTLTAPLDVAFGRTRTSTGLQPDYNKSTTYSDYITTQAPSSSTSPSNPEQPNKQDTPIPIPTPSPSTPPSSPEQSKSPKEQKKEEENQKKEEDKKFSDDAQKKSENYGKSIDKITPKLDDTKKFIDSNRRSEEKTKILDEIDDNINKFSIIINEYKNNTASINFNTYKPTDRPEDIYNYINTIKKFIKDKLLSPDGGFERDDYIKLSKRDTRTIGQLERELESQTNILKNAFFDDKTHTQTETLARKKGDIIKLSDKNGDYSPLKNLIIPGKVLGTDYNVDTDPTTGETTIICLTSKSSRVPITVSYEYTSGRESLSSGGSWDDRQKHILMRIQSQTILFSEGITNGLDEKEGELFKERKKINDIKPSDLKNQENKIIEHISKLSSLLQTSKGKIAAEKGNFWSGKITSINTEYIKEISEEINELQNELGGLSSGGEKSVHRKDIEKQLSPLFGKINEAFQALNT